MQCLKSLSNRKKNLLTFGIGFLVGVAGFWGLWWLVMDRFDIYRELGIYLAMPTIFLVALLSYITEKLGINVNGIWFIAFGWGVIIGLLSLLTRWLFVKKN